MLSTFATLAPRHGFVGEVLAATSRRPALPTTGEEEIRAWLGRAAERPRFSLEVAYVMTVLLLVVLGNPVDAFREASVRVQPRVTAVAGAVARPLSEMRAAGAERLSNVEVAFSPKLATQSVATAWGDSLVDGGMQWLQSNVLAPLQSLARGAGFLSAEIAAWASRVFDNVRRAFVAPPTEPPAAGVR